MMRTTLRDIDAGDLAYFRSDVSKDECHRGLDIHSGREVFVKQARDEDSARREYEALTLLAQAGGETLVPAPRQVRGREIHHELVEGIRLYDLLRLLRETASADPALEPRASDVAALLLQRCLVRLERMQQVLAGAASGLCVGPYPFEAKVVSMLTLLSHLLGLGPLDATMRRELDGLREVWHAHARLPFRDATPKNIIVAVECLALRRLPDAAARRACLGRMLAEGDARDWHTVPLLDIDFSSVEHLTTPEDDLVSLLAHQISFDAGAAVRVQGRTFLETLRLNPERSARTVFVRYLRFAGRKIAYRLINPRGCETRFRYDRPGFYLDAMPRLVADLSPELAGLMPATMARWSAIAGAAARIGVDATQDEDLYLKTTGRPPRYWQESPLELLAPGLAPQP